jgi:hypothetical protein
MPLRAITQAITEFEFHISPVRSSSRPHTGGRNLRDQFEYAPRMLLVAAQPPRAVHGLRNVGNVPVGPKTDLIAEDSKASRPAAADGAFAHDTALAAAPVVDRRLLDHEPLLRDFDLQRGVVEVAGPTPL